MDHVLNMDQAQLEFWTKFFCTRWVILVMAAYVADWFAGNLNLFFQNTRVKKVFDGLWFSGFWFLVFAVIATAHSFTFTRHFGSTLLGVGAGIMVGYGVMRVLRLYSKTMSVQETSAFATLSILFFPMLVYFVEPDMIAALMG